MGTLSELPDNLGKKVFGRNFMLPRWLDIPLFNPKYLLLGFFLYATLSMPAQGVQYFLTPVYGMIINAKMFDFLHHIGFATLIFVIVISVLSLFIRNAWCRYLYPYGALFGPFSLLSPFKIRRNINGCIDCGKCTENCPSNVPVDKLIQVRTVKCTGYMTYVESCPVASTLSSSLQTPSRARGNGGKSLQRQRTLPGAAMTLLVLGILFATVGHAVYADVWDTPMPGHTYFQLIPRAKAIGHQFFYQYVQNPDNSGRVPRAFRHFKTTGLMPSRSRLYNFKYYL